MPKPKMSKEPSKPEIIAANEPEEVVLKQNTPQFESTAEPPVAFVKQSSTVGKKPSPVQLEAQRQVKVANSRNALFDLANPVKPALKT